MVNTILGYIVFWSVNFPLRSGSGDDPDIGPCEREIESRSVPVPQSSGPVFRTDFDGKHSLEACGWEVQADDAQSQWQVREGHLEVVCHRSPYKGGQIVKRIPLLRNGTLDFDVKFAVSGGANYDHLCLGFRLYGQMTALLSIVKRSGE